jgi:AGZA family xanthine/uracil permease-like MFS transporter
MSAVPASKQDEPGHADNAGIAALPEGRVARYFGVRASGSTVGREWVAGLTTFGAMSYIIAVNPMILSAAGIDRHALIATTIIASVIGTLLMALWARLPVALAPGMGSNIIFAQVVVLQLGVSYQTAFTMVLVSAVLMLALGLSRWREKVVLGIPPPIRLGIQCAIGLFVAYLGMKSGGLVVVRDGATAFGNLADPTVLLTAVGVLAVPALVAARVPAALLVSIVVFTLIGFFVAGANGKPMTQAPQKLMDWPRLPVELFFAFDFHEFFRKFFVVLPITLYFFISDFFAATATLIGVTRRGKLMTPEGDIPNARRAYAADALASVVGAAAGTSTVVAYVESAAGIEAGGRTGLTALVVALLFALAWFFWPVIAIVPPQATAPALVMVGLLMLEDLRDIDASSPELCVPPLLTVLITVVATDLMLGMAAGLFSYTLLMLALRRARELKPVLLMLDAAFVLYIVLTLPTAR